MSWEYTSFLFLACCPFGFSEVSLHLRGLAVVAAYTCVPAGGAVAGLDMCSRVMLSFLPG